MEYSVGWLTCTHGRVSKLERNIRCFLDQTYTGYSLMYICNTGKTLTLSTDLLNLPNNRKIVISNITDKFFSSVGEKYKYAVNEIKYVHPSVNILTSADDDDIFLPSHISEGVKGIKLAYEQGKLAYKPQFSYYRYKENGQPKIIRNENTYEPSIFVDAKYLQEKGFAPVSIKYHQQWLDPLTKDNKILVDPSGISTLVYNWGDGDVYKMSGSGNDNQENFLAHKKHSLDMGNGILIPATDNSSYYREIEEFNKNK